MEVPWAKELLRTPLDWTVVIGTFSGVVLKVIQSLWFQQEHAACLRKALRACVVRVSQLWLKEAGASLTELQAQGKVRNG